MEYYYEEVEGKVWSEKEIRKALFNGIIDKQKEQFSAYYMANDVVTLDSDNQLLQLAINGKIEDVIDELTNVNNWNFVNVDAITSSTEYTDNICELRKLCEYFGKYYRVISQLYGKFEYQAITKNQVNCIKTIANNLMDVDYTIEKMLKEED